VCVLILSLYKIIFHIFVIVNKLGSQLKSETLVTENFTVKIKYS